MPERIQRKRTRGWRMPEGVRYVGRPGPYSNPYSVSEYGLIESRRRFRAYLEDHPELVERARRELRGLDLACWCSADAEWCHADDWLEVVNS